MVIGRWLPLAVLALLCLGGVSAVAPGVVVESVSQNWIHFHGEDVLTITGSGFRAHGSVTCEWLHLYQSTASDIVDDNTIRCKSPRIDHTVLEDVPLFGEFILYFDGNKQKNTVVVDEDFRIGPAFVGFSPTHGFVAGGDWFIVRGTGFDDFETAEIFFDGVPCPAGTNADTGAELPIKEGDGELRCVVPRGIFAQDATIDVQFDSNPLRRYRLKGVYRYGPRLESATPACGFLAGGTLITLQGELMNDPATRDSIFPARVELLVGDPPRRFFGQNVTISPVDGSVVFLTPSLGEFLTFGAEPEIQLFYGRDSNAITFSGLRYGPILYGDEDLQGNSIQNPSPHNLHVGGFDLITMRGCGLAEFAPSALSLRMQAFGETSARDICDRGDGPGSATDTLVVITDDENGELDHIQCVTRDFGACPGEPSWSGVVELVITELDLPVPTNNLTLRLEENAVTVGPQVDSTLSPARGPRHGGQLVTITGAAFLRTGDQGGEDWKNPFVHFASEELLDGAPILSMTDTEIVVSTPEGRFGLDTFVDIAFSTFDDEHLCENLPLENAPTYHYGPVCTHFTPTHGSLSGLETVQVFGEGFREEGNTVQDTEVRFCLTRLHPDGTANCRKFEESSTSLVRDATIETFVPSHRENVETIVGSNRLFGDQAEVYVHFLTPDGSGRDYNRDLLAPGLDVALVKCEGVYEFGPQITDFTPKKAPNGPFRSESSRAVIEPTKVTVHGSNFDDPLYNSAYRFSFGSALGETDDESVSDTSLTSTPLPGHAPNSDVPLTVTFGADCNVTASAFSMKWGTAFSGIGVGSTAPADAYGIHPAGTLLSGQVLTIAGSGFSEYVTIGDTVASFEGRCLIDNERVRTRFVNNQILCDIPPLPFGTSATVAVEFGTDCNDATTPIDWRNVERAEWRIHAGVRIDSFTPDFGHASGNTAVTVTGTGFSGFDSVECVFGAYSGAGSITSDSTVECVTPRTRGEFNTDVTLTLVFDGVESWRICADEHYHYGPRCTGVLPSSCDTVGCSAVAVGSGFQDCFVSDKEPIRNCVFREYIVEMVHPVTGDVIVMEAPTNDTLNVLNGDESLAFTIPELDFCGVGAIPQFQLRILDAPIGSGLGNPEEAQRVVQCDAGFQSGPVWSESTAEFQDEDGRMYGWEGDVITVSGSHFHHAAESVWCVFTDSATGVESTSAASVESDSRIVCPMPKHAFDVWADISIRWTGGVVDCDVGAGRVHYGPVLHSSAPLRGYVESQTEITIDGFAFECCGIIAIECLMPGAASANLGQPTPDQVVCLTPENENIDQLIANIGLRFSSLRFTESPQNTEDLVHTVDDGALTFYYGPFVDTAVHRVSLSARDERITFTGEGFADPYFTDVFCDFYSQTGAVDIIGEIKVEIPDKDDTSIICDVREFARTCGDWDLVRLRWRRTGRSFREEQGKFYWKTVAASVPQFDEPTFTDFGTANEPDYHITLSYTPEVTAVSTDRTAQAGGASVTVTMTNLRDWVSPNEETKDFGPGLAVCIWGDFRSEAVLLSPNQADVADTVWPTTFSCVTPPAPFGYEAPLSVALNPLEVAVGEEESETFHWTAHALDVSRRWGSEHGHEVVVVRGRGFCAYDSVTCFFGDRLALQSEITSDHSVTCITPQHEPGHVPVTLRLCHTVDGEAVCEFAGSEDRIRPVNINSDFTFVGISSISPHHGPVCGFTPVTVTGFGFRFFDEVRCLFNGQPRAATVLDDNTVQCLSPDASSDFDPDDNNVFCVPFEIQGLRSGRSFFYRSPQNFEFGFPQVTDVSPSTFDIDQGPVRLTISGRYLNGGDPDGEYRCTFGNFKTQAVIISGENDDDDLDSDTQVMCHTPERGDLLVGSYPVEVRYECDHHEEFTYNRFQVEVTQNPRVVSISPDRGAELGGQEVTIIGDDFNGGTLYLCAFGDVRDEDDFTAVQGQFTKGQKLPTLPISPLPSVGDSISAVDDDDDELSRFRGNSHSQAHSRPARAVQNRNDQIVCKVPFRSVKENTHVPLAISIDGGKTWVHSPTRFLYQNVFALDDGDVCPDSAFAETPTRSAASALVASLIVVVAAVALSALM